MHRKICAGDCSQSTMAATVGMAAEAGTLTDLIYSEEEKVAALLLHKTKGRLFAGLFYGRRYLQAGRDCLTSV
ncbi:MAG: hypothetical protein WBL23_18335 [Salinisphaera sp.]|uniref:hypothetical protein n=1 Tax=Salinisphaera sp. TaxID=1914330 RepID=UPI003C79DEC5